MGISDTPIYDDNNIVEFRTSQIKPIKQLFECIKNKIPETSLLFDGSQFKILQVDTARTFMVDVRLDGENFEHYYCNLDGGMDNIEININVSEINPIFKSVNKDDTVFTFYYKRNSSHVNIIFHNTVKKETKSFEISIQNPETTDDEDTVEIAQDNLDSYEYVISMPSSDLTGICKTLKNIGCTEINILHDYETLKFISLLPNNRTACITREGTRYGGDVDATKSLVFTKLPDSIDDVGPYSETFIFSIFSEFCRSHGSGDDKIVEILCTKDQPLILHYEIGDLGEMYIALATKNSVDDDDDEDIMM
jgi:proliferating cell nuclear antigen PCNA